MKGGRKKGTMLVKKVDYRGATAPKNCMIDGKRFTYYKSSNSYISTNISFNVEAMKSNLSCLFLRNLYNFLENCSEFV